MKKYLFSLMALATMGIANAQYASSVAGLAPKSHLGLDGLITAENYVRHHATIVDANGNAFVSAAFDTEYFEYSPIGVSAMVIKIGELGLQEWTAPMIGAATVKDLLSDGNGGVYVAGVFADEVVFYGTDGESITTDGYKEGDAYTTSQAASFIAHYNAEGKLLMLNKIVPEHDPKLDELIDPFEGIKAYKPVDGDIYCTVDKLMKDGDKLYAKFDYCGKVTAAENTATSGSMDMFGWGMYYQAMKAAGVAELDQNLGFKKVIVNMYTNSFSALYNLQEVFSSTATLKDGHLYMGAIGNGDVNVASFDGGITLSHEMPESGGYNFGYIVADFNLNDPSKSQIKSRIGASADDFLATTMKDMYFSGDLLMISGNFQGSLGFDKAIEAIGSSDIYTAALNPSDLSVVATKASGYNEGEKTDYEEIYTSSTVCGSLLFINGYAAIKKGHVLTAPLCYIYDMTTGTLTDVSNGSYIFGTAAGADGKCLLTAWAAPELTGTTFSLYDVDPAGVSDATIGNNGVKVFATDATVYTSEACDVEIVALNGATVAAAKSATSIGIAALPAGIYLVRTTTAAGVGAAKIVKR